MKLSQLLRHFGRFTNNNSTRSTSTNQDNSATNTLSDALMSICCGSLFTIQIIIGLAVVSVIFLIGIALPLDNSVLPKIDK